MRKLLILACVALLSACSGGQHSDLRAQLARLTKNLRGHVPPLPHVEAYEPVPYKGKNGIDPFSPKRIVIAQATAPKAGKGALKPDLSRPREPLEAFPLDSLKWVGTITIGKQVYGLIEVGKVLYRVRKGNYMGQHFGVITSITDRTITLKELIQDSNGEWVQRTSTLQLQGTKK